MMEGGKETKGAAASGGTSEENKERGQMFFGERLDTTEVYALASEIATEGIVDNTSDELDDSKYTPKTSNKRTISIPSTAEGTLSAIHEQQTTSLPLQNPLHNIEDQNDGDGGGDVHVSESQQKSHFTVDEGLDHDLRPVAPIRKASDGSFQGASAKVRALTREMNFDGDFDDDDDDGDKAGSTTGDGESTTSSYVGDIDQRSLQEKDIQFQPDGYLSVEPSIPPKQGSFPSSSVHTKATGIMSASGATASSSSMAALSPMLASSGEKEINFSPGGSDITGSEAPKQGSFQGNLADFVGDDRPDLPLTSDSKDLVAVKGTGMEDTTLLDMQELLDAALDDKVIVASETTADTPPIENPLSESNIPSESFLKMGAMMQSLQSEPDKSKERLTENRRDDALVDLLDEGLIFGGEREDKVTNDIENSKDEHDDLLDTMLGEDRIEGSHKETEAKIEQFAKDPEDELLDAMLDDKDSADETKDDYVPDEAILKLEALLDEGLLTEPVSAAESRKAAEASEQLQIEASDSMARELDALLDGNLEVELNFEVEETQPLKTRSSKAIPKFSTKVKLSSGSSKSKERSGEATNKPPTAEQVRQKKPMVPRFFSKEISTKKRNETGTERAPTRSRALFGSGAARKATESVRKRFSSSDKRETATTAKTVKNSKVPSGETAKMPSRKFRTTTFAFTSPKRFMSPAIAFKRHVCSAEEDRAPEHRARHESPTPSSPKSSWGSSKKSFMSSTFSSLRKLRCSSASSEEMNRRTERRNTGDLLNPDGSKSRISGAFMEPTFAKTMLETETRIIEERKALEREEELKKRVVDLLPWEEDRKPSPFLDYSFVAPKIKQSPKEPRRPEEELPEEDNESSTTQRRRILWTPNKDAAPKDQTASVLPIPPQPPKVESSPHSVFSPRSHGSLSSQCSIRSFISPDKAGIVGCQSKYNPYLHKTKGPCELCVFRLSEDAKDELDAKGRHLLVQFTTGGCPECIEFPTSFDEDPVRLCTRCYAISHRPKQTRRRKKGNDAARIGYTFAKKEYS